MIRPALDIAAPAGETAGRLSAASVRIAAAGFSDATAESRKRTIVVCLVASVDDELQSQACHHRRGG
jgi:hypothetical protein